MPVFDEAARGQHAEDFQLLHYGHVHLYRNGWARDRLVADLRAIGYDVFAVDVAALCRRRLDSQSRHRRHP